MEIWLAYGKSLNAEIRRPDNPVRVEFPTRQQAMNWCASNREWMVYLWVDGPAIGKTK